MALLSIKTDNHCRTSYQMEGATDRRTDRQTDKQTWKHMVEARRGLTNIPTLRRVHVDERQRRTKAMLWLVQALIFFLTHRRSATQSIRLLWLLLPFTHATHTHTNHKFQIAALRRWCESPNFNASDRSRANQPQTCFQPFAFNYATLVHGSSCSATATAPTRTTKQAYTHARTWFSHSLSLH